MSKGTIKKQLIREAIAIYRKIVHTHDYNMVYNYSHLCRLFRIRGWKIFAGAEKFVATKGPIVAKWRRPYDVYSKHPVKDIYKIYREMDKRNMHSLHPRIYFHRPNFYVEQRCQTPRNWDSDMLNKYNTACSAVNDFAMDIHDRKCWFYQQ
jgi:hypothetical protein